MKNRGLASFLFGKTRVSVLTLLFSHPEDKFYFRHILRSVRAGHGAVQRELKTLNEAGIIRRTISGRQVYYQADQASPIFPELKSLIAKTAGIGDVLRHALSSLSGRLKAAFVYGSIAKGDEKQNSDIDLFIVGDASFSDVVLNLQAAQRDLGREVNPTVYSNAEFLAKVGEKHHFVTSVLSGPKIYFIGDEIELERLAQKRLARRTRSQPTGNLRSSGHRRKRSA